MTKEEIYYRRTYRLLNDLIYTYRNGYDKKEIEEFWNKKNLEFLEGSKIFNEQKEGLLLTIIIALMGINKESTEKREVVKGYNDSFVEFDFRNIKKDTITEEKLVEFDNYRNKETIFDKWLSINKAPDSDRKNSDIIRRIRNGLLHSNFNVDTDSKLLSFTNIKTKSYYESKILNQNFQQFIMANYSNVPTVGVCDKTILFYKNICDDIVNEDVLRKWLLNTTMLEVEHSIENFDGFNTLDNKIAELLKQNNKEQKIMDEIYKENNDITIKSINTTEFTEETVEFFIKIVKNRYKEDFYKLPEISKEKILHNIFEYFYKNKRQISNWLLHFYHLIGNTVNSNYSVDDIFYYDDEYATMSLKPTLSILKAYLILYRLQNEKFDKIDYNLIEFDFEEDYVLWSEYEGIQVNDDYYQTSFDKLRSKYTTLPTVTIQKQIICEVIRDGLAHGNITSYICEDGVDYIQIKDIYNNKARCISMTLEKFNKFINSEAFLPKYCVKKEKESKINQIIKKLQVKLNK